MRLSRRHFLKLGAAAGAAALLPFPAFGQGTAEVAAAATGGTPDLVALLSAGAAGPAAMFEEGVKRLGGIGRFVKKGQFVLVKPNIGWDRKPELAANTNPALVAAVVSACVGAGAAKVVVVDNTCNNWRDCYRNSGIERAATEGGASVLPGNDAREYRKVKLAKAKVLKDADVHGAFLDADVVIDLPVVKHHAGAQMTCAMKNWMGVVDDRRFWHRAGLHECIAEFNEVRRPDLVVVDAWNIMTQNGPRGLSANDVVEKRMQVLATDIVAADAAAARILGLEPSDIRYIGLAESMGFGSAALDTLKIDRVTL